jgi:hypothetical protein
MQSIYGRAAGASIAGRDISGTRRSHLILDVVTLAVELDMRA